MSFISYSFLFLFAVTLLFRWTLGRNSNDKSYLALLLGASLVFYASYKPSYLFLLLGISGIDFYLGQKISETASLSRKRIYLFLSVASNLGLLAFFKYSNFLLEAFWDVRRIFEAGLPAQAKLFDLELPLGISFFTFQSMSYTIDIYRGILKPEKLYWRFLLFVAFFTHLISGPIVRAKELIYQFDRKRTIVLSVFLNGVFLLVRGYFLKMVVADNLASYVNRYWNDNVIIGGSASVSFLLAFLFACQIFADFEGYTSIARGGAYLLGFRLPSNFNCPYLATSFRDFWSRWHITLSHWMRDYLYISLGGNRVTEGRLYFNLMLTMVLAGLWHGAAYTFIVWGAIHGAALVVERALGVAGILDRFPWLKGFWFVMVQGVVLIAWVFFRSADLNQAVLLTEHLFTKSWDWKATAEMIPGLAFALPVVLMHLGGFLRERQWAPPPVPMLQGALCAIMLYLILSLHGVNNAFIYFQF